MTDAERSTLELILRMFMEQCIRSVGKQGGSIEGARVPALLDLSIELAAASIVDPNTPFALFEDLFDAQVKHALRAPHGDSYTPHGSIHTLPPADCLAGDLTLRGALLAA